MKPSERDDLIRRYFEQDMDLLKAKGHDYAGTEDCLANLKRFGLMGIIVRLSDKFSRIESLAKVGFDKAEVKSESIIDTLRDIRNYAFLAQIFAEGEDGREFEIINAIRSSLKTFRPGDWVRLHGGSITGGPVGKIEVITDDGAVVNYPGYPAMNGLYKISDLSPAEPKSSAPQKTTPPPDRFIWEGK